MLPATFDLELYQGDDFLVTFRIRNTNADGSLGTYVDLTGYTPKAQIRSTPTATTVIAEFTCTIDPDQTANPGQLTIALAAATTKDLPIFNAAGGSWDLEMIGADTKKHTYLRGKVTVDPETTRT